MAACFSALSDDNIDVGLHLPHRVAHVADQSHHLRTGFARDRHDPGWVTQSRREDGHVLFHDDVDLFPHDALAVVADRPLGSVLVKAELADQSLHKSDVLRICAAQCVPRRLVRAGAIDLADVCRQQQIDPKRLVGQFLDPLDGFAQILRRNARSADDAQSSGLGHRGDEFRRRVPTSKAAHAGHADRVLNAKDVAQIGAQYGASHDGPPQ